MAKALTEPGTRRDCTCPRVRHEHGTAQAFNRDACRCLPCRAANAAAQRAYTRRLAKMRWDGGAMWTSTIGTRRRLQALAAIGWTMPQIAHHLGYTDAAVHHLRTRGERMLTSTAAKVTAVYEQLSHIAPEGRYANRARNAARRHGWAPPLAWDDDTIDDPAAKPAGVRRGGTSRDVDEVAVAEALAGRPVALTRHERAAAVRLAAKRGLGAERTAELLGTTTRTVGRDRAKVAA